MIELIVRLAEKTAVYAAGKISVWNHYQPKEPERLYGNRIKLK